MTTLVMDVWLAEPIILTIGNGLICTGASKDLKWKYSPNCLVLLISPSTINY